MAEGLVSDLFLFLKKVLYKLKASDLQLTFNVYISARHSINTNYKILDYWFRDMLSFEFLEEGLGIISPP